LVTVGLLAGTRLTDRAFVDRLHVLVTVGLLAGTRLTDRALVDRLHVLVTVGLLAGTRLTDRALVDDLDVALVRGACLGRRRNRRRLLRHLVRCTCRCCTESECQRGERRPSTTRKPHRQILRDKGELPPANPLKHASLADFTALIERAN